MRGKLRKHRKMTIPRKSPILERPTLRGEQPETDARRAESHEGPIPPLPRLASVQRGHSTTVMEIDGNFDFESVAQPRLGDRTVTTVVRLSRQGFKESRSGVEFTFKSIPRGR